MSTGTKNGAGMTQTDEKKLDTFIIHRSLSWILLDNADHKQGSYLEEGQI